MTAVALVLAGLLALLHAYILVLEMFLWTKPQGRAVFGMTREFADATRVLGQNQGLYNGFLAAGLLWGVVAPEPLRKPVIVFFAACVLVAGVYGAATASRRILVVQALPGAITLLAALLFL